ncbi:MAG: hypothetical protein ACP5JH_09755 [Bacteroidota bacterium]
MLYRYILISLSLLLFSSSTRADRRYYVWTYQYATQVKGNAEFENYLTLAIPHRASLGISHWEHRLELEYGITNRWDVSFYQIFSVENPEGTLRYSGFQLRSRLRFFEAGDYFVDPLLYIEYIRKPDLRAPNKIEGKLVLAKDIGKANLSTNIIGEWLFGGTRGFESGFAAGLSYELTPAFRLGVEATGNFEQGEESELAFGPVLSIATRKFWWTLGAVFGSTAATQDIRIRALLGIDL